MAEDQELMLPPLEERPLVTFALFAYNQEKYIREAVEGAFAQTYEPLEIILSDDCSTDRTFEIMEAMASQYDGQNRIRIRRNPDNLGVLKHVIHVAHEARGEFIILAAGDDISSADRTRKLTNMWMCGFDGVFSNYDLINSDSKRINVNRCPKGSASSRLPWLKNIKSDFFVYGSTSSYSKKVFESLIEPCQKVQSEDTPLNTVLHRDGGKVGHLPEPLVEYRIHDDTLSLSAQVPTKIKQIIEYEIKEQKKAEQQLALLAYIRELISMPKANASLSIDMQPLARDIEISCLKSSWLNLSPAYRLTKIFQIQNGVALKWAILRIAGIRVYATLKWAHRMIFRTSYIELK